MEKYPACNSKKSRYIKIQEAIRLLSDLVIKNPISKIIHY